MVDRTDRETETRADEARARPWSPPQILPDPSPRQGWHHRYVRVSIYGEQDPTNVSQRLREGWEPCKSEDYPEIMAQIPGTIAHKNSGGNIEIGGLLLCRMPEEMWQKRKAYYDNLAQRQLEGVDNAYLREADPRMPMHRPERSTKITFGRKK